MKLHLHIDRLIVPPGVADDPARLAAAVQAAISSHLHGKAASDVLAPDLQHGGARDRVAPLSAPHQTPAALPGTIAGAVLGALRGPTR